MADIGTLTNYTGGSVLYAASLNSDFGAIRTVVNGAVVHTDKASQVITKSITFTPDSGVAFTVSTGGATITAGNLTLTAGDVALTAGNLTFGAASAKVIPGATSLLFRDNGDANTNLSITDAGNVAIRGTLDVTGAATLSSITGITSFTASGTITADTFAGGSASSKILTGSTNTLIRNSTDSTTLLTITNGGAITQATGAAWSFGGGAVGTAAASGASVGITAGSTGNVTITAATGFAYLGAAGAMTTTDTTGFGVFRTVAGTPTGSISTAGAHVWDTTAKKLWIHDGSAWRFVTFT